jgi:hypothetical protein
VNLLEDLINYSTVNILYSPILTIEHEPSSESYGILQHKIRLKKGNILAHRWHTMNFPYITIV